MKVKTIKASWGVHLQVPTVPDFFIESAPSVVAGEQGKYPISDFPDNVLDEVGHQWTEKLKARAEEMRRYRNK